MNARIWAGVTATAVSVAALYGASTRNGRSDSESKASLLAKGETTLKADEVIVIQNGLDAKAERRSKQRRIFSEAIEKLPSVFPLPSNIWNVNWDARHTSSNQSASSDQSHDGTVNSTSLPTSSRHLFLIRHGQYHTEKAREIDRKLTELGSEQLDLTGQRLADLGIQFDRMVASTMTRAQESARIIHKRFPDLNFESDRLLEEGAPVPPEPPMKSWAPPLEQFLEDGPRIEAAFRKYFHRADVSQSSDSHEILVCHGNVIRFFVCRALQIPPEAWLRMGVNHGSITWLTVRPSGRVVLQSLGTTGYMPPKKISV